MSKENKSEMCSMSIDLTEDYFKMAAKVILMTKLLEISKHYLDINNPKTPDLIKRIEQVLSDER